ncbi:uncharacterized protein ACN2A1_002926 [Glossina fuscipes fuscipes]
MLLIGLSKREISKYDLLVQLVNPNQRDCEAINALLTYTFGQQQQIQQTSEMQIDIKKQLSAIPYSKTNNNARQEEKLLYTCRLVQQDDRGGEHSPPEGRRRRRGRRGGRRNQHSPEGPRGGRCGGRRN